MPREARPRLGRSRTITFATGRHAGVGNRSASSPFRHPTRWVAPNRCSPAPEASKGRVEQGPAAAVARGRDAAHPCAARTTRAAGARAHDERLGDPKDKGDARGQRGVDRASVRDEGPARGDQSAAPRLPPAIPVTPGAPRSRPRQHRPQTAAIPQSAPAAVSVIRTDHDCLDMTASIPKVRNTLHALAVLKTSQDVP
jgi:hypothetical protein